MLTGYLVWLIVLTAPAIEEKQGVSVRANVEYRYKITEEFKTPECEKHLNTAASRIKMMEILADLEKNNQHVVDYSVKCWW